MVGAYDKRYTFSRANADRTFGRYGGVRPADIYEYVLAALTATLSVLTQPEFGGQLPGILPRPAALLSSNMQKRASRDVEPQAAALTATRAGARADLVDETYARIRGFIISGRLAPGARIVEKQMAERLHVSRTPVRSALLRLEQEGYVNAAEGGKYVRLVVSPLTQKDAYELYNIVAELEGLAARWAANLQAPARAELTAQLTVINGELFRLASAQELDGVAVFQAHTDFHGCIVGAADAPRLHALHAAVKPQAERYRRVYSSASAENTRASAQEHVAIIEAIEHGDAAAAEEFVVLNWRNSAERLSEHIRRTGEWGTL